MNVLLKCAALSGLVLGVVALGVALQTKRDLSARVAQEVERQLDRREKALVDQFRPTVTRMLADMGQPKREINTLEDVITAYTSVFNLVGELPPPAAPPKR